MKTRLLALLALPAFACAPSVGHTDSPAKVDIAVFDPTTGSIPLPNDLALIPANQAGQPAAQVQLLNAFAAKGGFPNDQEVAITISFQTQTIGADGTVTNSVPDIDVVNQISQAKGTLVVFLQTASSVGPVALDPIKATDYANGTLTLHNKGHLPWAPGEYIVGIRGGANGAQAADGTPIVASSTFFLIAQGRLLTSDADLALLRAQAGTTAGALALEGQLNAIITGYLPAFAAVDQVFPHQELAVMTTFAVAPAKTQVQLDPNRGLVPLPIDLLRDPRATTDPTCAAHPGCGLLTAVAACTLANGTIDPATGVCSQAAAAAGFASLDGFSTTGFILAPTSDLLVASTITPTTVQLYDLTTPATPVLVDASTYITEPAEVQQQGLSPVVALQPAGATASDQTSVFRTRPLKDNTSYAIVIGDGVKDKTGASIIAGTVGSILQITAPLVTSAGVSQLAGVDNTTAGALEIMRQQLVPVLVAANSKGITTGHVAMAYTFKTQSILSVGVQLGALPYTKDAATGTTAALTSLTPAQAFAKYGVPPTVVNGTGGNGKDSNIAEIDETTITTFKLLDPATGAFKTDPTQAVAETINVMIALPKASTVPACPGGAANQLSLFGNCSPLVVFRHGLGRGRADMLTVADTFNAKGMTVIAIDAAKHGDRSFCTPSGSPAQCAAGFSCVSPLPAGAQADASPPGCCLPTGTAPTAANTVSCGTTSGFQYLPVSSACQSPGACGGYAFAEGIPAVSANYLISANFFRTRDTMRQDIIDQSQLIRAVAFVPTAGMTPPPNSPSPLLNKTALQSYIVDPTNISYVGQSLGSIQGAVDVATNPRISKAVLNVGGGTVTDVFANSPAFVANTNQLLAGLGISPGTSAYLQFLVVAKTILDPADPINFADHLTANTLPNLLPPLGGNTNGSVPQAAKNILTQVAFCDQTVPNPFEFILDSNIVCGPTPIASCAAGAKELLYGTNFTSGTPGLTGHFQLFFNGATGGVPTSPADAQAKLAACPAPPTSGLGTKGLVTHGFITDWVDPSATTIAQCDAAKFLAAGTLPPSLEFTSLSPVTPCAN
jgi:hypothetical protein